MSIALPLLVCLLGLIVWAVASQSPKPNQYVIEGGRIAYSYGLLVSLFAVMTHQVTALSAQVSAYVSLIASVLGFLIWILSSNGVLKEAGKIMFKWGLFVYLVAVMTRVVHF